MRSASLGLKRLFPWSTGAHKWSRSTPGSLRKSALRQAAARALLARAPGLPPFRRSFVRGVRPDKRRVLHPWRQ
eukprot:6184520-Pleurochrysis_carterae.AAC.2